MALFSIFQCSKDLGIPLSKARFVPKSVKRRFSGLDLLALLERMKTASERKDLTELLTLSTQLQKLSNMIASVPLPPVEYYHDRPDELESLQAKYCQSVVYTNASVETVSTNGGEDCNTSRYLSYCWFGVDKSRYAEIDMHTVNGRIDDGSSWQSSNCVVKLKELGSDYCKEISMHDSCKKYEGDSSYDEGNQDIEILWKDEDKQAILNWLGVSEEIEVEMFKSIMPVIQLEHESLSIACHYQIIEESKWKGYLSSDEIDWLMRLFLNDEPDWAKEIEFIANKIKVKLILMDRVKKGKFKTENARDEFLQILERSAMRIRAFHDIKFSQLEVDQRDLEEDVELIIHHKEAIAVRITWRQCADIQCLFDSTLKLELLSICHIPVSNSNKKNFNKYLGKLIDVLELKHLKVADLKEAFDKILQFPDRPRQ